MTFCSAFQWNSYQNNAYQIARAAPASGGSPSGTYSQFYPFQLEKVEKEKKAALKRQKSDLDRIDSVLAENRRLMAMAAENKLLAKEVRALELAAKEQEYLEEINRLLMVRAGLVLKMRRNEQFIIAIVLMKKRRLRVLH